MNNGKLSWSFFEIWNESLEEGKKSRSLIPREKIWASELGKAPVDIYLKMKAIQPSNPPNARSLRKFEAGNIWEYIVGYVLRRAGILIDKQKWLSYQYEGLFPVTGKLDYFAGGKPDYDKALSQIEKDFDWLPLFIAKATKKIVERLKTEYPDGLENIILEIKSCSSFMFERYLNLGTASPHHKLQLFHYLKATNKREGHICYISKDDARMLEIGVLNPSPIEEVYKETIRMMTHSVTNDICPLPEKPIIFDEMTGRITPNWKVGYSPYLTYLYGFKDQKEFDDKYRPMAERWKRVIKRIKEGKNLTDNNKEVIKEMEEAGFNIDKIVESAQGQKDQENGEED